MQTNRSSAPAEQSGSPPPLRAAPNDSLLPNLDAGNCEDDANEEATVCLLLKQEPHTDEYLAVGSRAGRGGGGGVDANWF